MADDNRNRVESVARIFDEWQRLFAAPTIALVRSDRPEAASGWNRSR
jgi:hypothetical protein